MKPVLFALSGLFLCLAIGCGGGESSKPSSVEDGVNIKGTEKTPDLSAPDPAGVKP